MKTIRTLLPFIPFLFLIGAWTAYSYMDLKAELVEMTNRATTAEYSLTQERKFQKEREEFRAELDKKFRDFDAKLSSYTQTLRGIANERNKNGVDNSLSEPVTRVLKQYTDTRNQN